MSTRKRPKNEQHPGVYLMVRGKAIVAEWHEPDLSGKQQRKRLSLSQHFGYRSKVQATGWAKQKAKELKNLKSEVRYAGNRLERDRTLRARTSIAEAVEAYLEEHSRNQSQRECANERSRFQVFRDWLSQVSRKGIVLGEDVTSHSLYQLRKFIDARRSSKGGKDDQPISENTKDAYRRCLVRFFKWGRKEGYFNVSSDDIAENFERFKPGKRQPIQLSAPKLQALIEAAKQLDAEELWGKPRYKPILPYLVLLMLTGMRKSEVLNLRWEHVDFHLQTIKVASGDQFRPKGDAERVIPLDDSPMLLAYLKQLFEAKSLHEFVVPGEDWFTPRNVRQDTWKRLATLAGLPEVNAKDLRSTFATCVGRGMPKMADRYLMAERMGHSVTTAARHYVGPKPPTSGESVEECLGIAGVDLGS